MKWIALDIETTGLDPFKDKLHGIGVAYEEDSPTYYPADKIPASVRRDLADPKITKIGHYLRGFDARFLRVQGIMVKGPLLDTMHIWKSINENQPLGLKYLSEKYLGAHAIDKKRALDRLMEQMKCRNVAQLCAKDLLDPERPYFNTISEYCCEDVNDTVKLTFMGLTKLKEISKILTERFGAKKTPLDYLWEEIVPAEEVLFEMEMRGIRVNMEEIARVRQDAQAEYDRYAQKLTDRCRDQIKSIEDFLYQKARDSKATPAGKDKVKREDCRFSWQNPGHVGMLLFEKIGVPKELEQKTKNGRWCTTESYLASVHDTLPKGHKVRLCIKSFAKLKKTLKVANTYTGDDKRGIVSKLHERNGKHYIFAKYPQLTKTWRLSSQEPNMQNLKRGSPVKKFFRPDADDAIFVHLDYSQVELRIAAHLSQDSTFLEGFNKGLDLHAQTGSVFFQKKKLVDEERQCGKKGNFLMIFDGRAPRLKQVLYQELKREFSLEQCKGFIKRFFEYYQEYREYLDSQKAFVEKYKFVIAEAGAIRRLPDIVYGKGLTWERGHDDRWVPVFRGKRELEARLVEELTAQKRAEWKRKKKTGEPPAPGALEIGWLAYRKYSHALKQAYNFPIQNMGAVFTKRAMIALHRAGYKLVSQVHDSIDIELRKKDLHKVKEIISLAESVYKISVPLKADVKLLRSFDEKDVAEDCIKKEKAA